MRAPSQWSRAAAPWLALVGLAVGVRWGIGSALDLRDLPGPGGVQSLVRLLQEQRHPSALVALLKALIDPEAGLAEGAWRISWAASLAMVAGGALAGGALGGRRGALAAGLLASTWTLTVTSSIHIGPDPIAAGLSWLGVGLCWMGSRRAPWGLPLLAAGGVLVAWAVAIKPVALPALGLLALAPLLAPKIRYGVISGVALAALTAWVWTRLAPTRALPVSTAISPWLLLDGVDALRGLREQGLSAGVVGLVLLISAVGVATPARGQGRAAWVRQLLMGLMAVLGVLLVAGAGGEKLRPRYLLPAFAGAFAFAGAGLAHLGTWLPRRLAAVPALGVAALLFVDTWAHVESYARWRTVFAGAPPATLPAAPRPWTPRHELIALHALLDHFSAGSVELVGLVEEAPVGVAIPPLRDRRDPLVLLSAWDRGRAALVLDPKNCCPGRAPDAVCAAEVVAAVDAAGLTLALPVMRRAVPRVDAPTRPWVQELVGAAERAGGLSLEPQGETPERWWQVRPASGADGALPCRPPSRRGHGGPLRLVDRRPAAD